MKGTEEREGAIASALINQENRDKQFRRLKLKIDEVQEQIKKGDRHKVMCDTGDRFQILFDEEW